MSKRKNLNDAIYGDRAEIRGYSLPATSSSKWDDGNIFDFEKGKMKGHKSTYGTGERCYKSHPPLPLPGTDLVIYGGSCLNPVVLDADIYIGFDGGMTFTERQFPWTPGHEFLFKITDMDAPKDHKLFAKLVSWTRDQLEIGMKVHCGCIGGHGRTGTFLAALVSTFGEKDAITYVREHYCQKAVESSVQIKFLAKHFGIKEVSGSKSGKTYSGFSDGKKSVGRSRTEKYEPIAGNGGIWARE